MEGIGNVSSTVSGQGRINLPPLLTVGRTPPNDGAILYVFYVDFQVTSFDDDLIWSQVSADTVQIRGGRLLTFDGTRPAREIFVSRLFNRIERLTYLSFDPSELVNGGIGSGGTQALIDLGFDGHSQATELGYDLAEGVSGRALISGYAQYYYNSENSYRYIPIRGTFL